MLFVGISSAVTVSHPLTFGYVRENPGPVARGDARGCNEHTANLDAPTRNLQNIKHKHADQHAKTRDTLSHPRVALLNRRGWPQLAFKTVCALLKSAVCN